MKAIYIILFSFLMVSCRPPFNKDKFIDCEVTPPQCLPTEWMGKAIDTSYYNNGKNYYYQIKQVEGLNTAKQEYGVYLKDVVYSIGKKQKATFATISKEKEQKIYHIYQGFDQLTGTKANDKFEVGEELFVNYEGDFGFPVYISPNELIVSSTQLSNDNYQTISKVGLELQELNATIGQSRIYDSKSEMIKEINTSLDSKRPHLIWESHPAYDSKNNILFFASDRAGGYGGVDIWYMYKNENGWSTPINCGANVNTQCDDITPFVSSTKNKLYFSTTGRDNVGGYDIFHLDYNVLGNEISFPNAPLNMGAPVNTKYDEFSPTFPNYSDNYFYYSSDRDGDFDIYVLQKIFKEGKDSLEFEPEEEQVEKIDFTVKEDTLVINPTFNLGGIVKDNRTNEPVENVDVTVKRNQEQTPHKSTKTDNKGKYEFELEKGHEYKVEVKNDTLFNDSYKVFVDKKDTNTSIKRDLVFDVVKTVRINFKYDQSDKPYEFILDSLGNQENTTWQEAIDNLAEDIKKSQSILSKVVITGHTDPVASNSYNKQLAQKRAEFVVSQLVQRGIPIYLLIAKSKGETEKLVKFDNELEEQYHKRLRRVTLEKIFIK